VGFAHLKVDTITFIAAVSACEKGGRCDLACRILVEMGAAIVHLKVDTITYIAAVIACEKGGWWDHA
jgi:hypothetical protein